MAKRKTKLKGPEDHTALIRKLFQGSSVSDEEFDRIYPKPIRKLSNIHWSPIQVIRAAVEFLVDRPGKAVLDVGSGAGKFCLVGSLISPGLFTGTEYRKRLAELSTQIAGRYKIERAHFETGNITDVDWTRFEAFYLFNPFCEHLYSFRRIDVTVETGIPFYDEYIEFVEYRLEQAAPGTRVALYHGFGGRMPPSYQKVSEKPMGSGSLQCWLKKNDPQQ